MTPRLRLLAAVVAVVVAVAAGVTHAQKPGGVLKMSHFDSPASMSPHEEATAATLRPMMGVFNNLVIFKQDEPQNTLKSIVPDLATSWEWNEEGTALTFQLRHGVKWHDGKPFTAADVKCTWEMLAGISSEKFRINPRKSWYRNLEGVTINGEYEVVFRLGHPQPALLTNLASGYAPVYPCHVSPRDMRQRPIGTGPFKFVEFKPNEYIKVTRNQDYWKPGRPFLDGIEYAISHNRSTAILAFAAGKYELTFAGTLTIPPTRDLQCDRPDAICEIPPASGR